MRLQRAGRRFAVCGAIAVAMFTVAVGAAEEESSPVVQSVNVLPYEDASPVENPEGEISITTQTEDGNDGFFLRPEVRFGTPFGLELGVRTEVQQREGEVDGGALAGHAQAAIIQESRAVPKLALRGVVSTPDDRTGWSAEGRVIATKTFGALRLHGNATWRPKTDDNDLYGFTVAADRMLGESWIVTGDAYLFDAIAAEERARVGGDLGAGIRVSEGMVLTGALGVVSADDGVDPRVLVGMTGRL